MYENEKKPLVATDFSTRFHTHQWKITYGKMSRV